MGIKTIAAHVETDEVLSAAKRIGIDYYQGHRLDIPTAFVYPKMGGTERKAS